MNSHAEEVKVGSIAGPHVLKGCVDVNDFSRPTGSDIEDFVLATWLVCEDLNVFEKLK